MARLRNVNSGAIVDVPDEKVERLGIEWEPVEASQEEQKSTRSRAKKPAAE